MKKRFIAGARCPKCEEIDKIVVYRQDDQDIRECVNCGYTDKVHFQSHIREPVTRVNQTEEMKAETVQVLEFPPK